MATASNRRGATKGPKAADTWPIVVATINGMSFVGGLHWHNIKQVNIYLKEAQINGAAWAADVVAFRTASSNKRQIQAGFAPKRAGAFKGMYSWASAVASIVGDNCLAGFKITEDTDDHEGLYGIVCQLDGLIVAGSDRIVTKAEFDQTYRTIYNRVATAQNKITRMIAPAEFNVAEEELDIGTVLTSRTVTKAHRLKALNRFDYSAGDVKKYVVIGGFAMLGVYGLYVAYGAYAAKRDAIERDRRAVERAANEAKQEELDREVELKNVYPHEWIDLAAPGRMLEVCTPALNASNHGGPPISVGGWLVSAVSCSTDKHTPKVIHVAYTYSRSGKDGPTWEQFKTAAEKFFRVTPVATDGTFGAGTVGLAKAFEGSGDDTLAPDNDEAKGALASHFQSLGEATPLNVVEPIKPPADNPHPPRQEWTEYTFETTAEANPATRLAGLAQPGVRITGLAGAIDKEAAQIKWTITGSLYVKR